MTNEQKYLIERLRASGQGYKAVAKAVGLPKETVKSFCRRNSVFGNHTQAVEKEKKGFCPQCGKAVERKEKTKPRRFCSAACRQAWWNAHPERVGRKAVYTFVCEKCGKPFTAYGNDNRKYCSHVCYIKARFRGGAAHDA